MGKKWAAGTVITETGKVIILDSEQRGRDLIDKSPRFKIRKKRVQSPRTEQWKTLKLNACRPLKIRLFKKINA